MDPLTVFPNQCPAIDSAATGEFGSFNYIFKIFELHGLLAEWKKLALSLGLPIEKLQVQAYSQFSLTKLLNAMRSDKKKDGQDIQIVLLKDMGEPFVCRLDLEQFLKKVEEYDEFKS
jgi:3-dehydroquinate synthetase